VRHRIERGRFSAEYDATLRIGSGKVGSSFGVRIAGQWFQSPISWYAQTKQFRISPGYEKEKYPDFDRRIRSECLYCHSSLRGSQPVAITCDRCHGEGEAHALKPSRDNIVNPARLAGGVRDSVCEQCHLPGAVRVLNPGKQATQYAPGQLLEDTWTTYVVRGDFRVASHSERLAESACMKAGAESRMWCGSCHNPHPTASRLALPVDAVCRSCHQLHDGGRGNCQTCHMPKRNVRDVVHASYTDHRIQRPRQAETETELGLRTWRPGPYGERNFALAWFEWAASTRDRQAIERAAALIGALAAREEDARILSAKAAIAPAEKAIDLYREVTKLEPDSAEARLRLGRAYQAAGEMQAALESYQDAMRLDPLLFEAYVSAAQVHRFRGDREKYRRVLQDYLRRVPRSLAARQALAAAE
jgi:predicted CXXCH cytochrome family protein